MSAAGSGVKRFDFCDFGPEADMRSAALGEYMLHEDHDRIVAALLAERGWRPIREAPKDGRTIWVFDPSNWHIYPNGWQYECVWNGAGWYHGFGDGFPFPTPTHWQPLPAPPAIAQGGGT